MPFTLVRAAAVCAALAAVAAPVLAGEAPQDQSAQVVVRDATTGRLRAATASEASALAAPRAAVSGVLARPLPRQHVSGAQGARLTDASMSYAILVRQADGSFAEQCFSSKEEAEAAVKAASLKTNTLATE